MMPELNKSLVIVGLTVNCKLYVNYCHPNSTINIVNTNHQNLMQNYIFVYIYIMYCYELSQKCK